MAWNDPSPRTRSLPAASRPAAQPGYGDAPISFGRLMFRVVIAGLFGVFASVVVKSCLAALHGNAAHASALDLVLAAAAGFVVAALAWKTVMNRPTRYGLSARVRDGGGWGGSWRRDACDDNTFGDVIVVDAVSDLIEVALDIATDL